MENWQMGMNNPLTTNFNSMGRMANMAHQNSAYLPPAPRYEVIRVNGEAGARNFRMAPNSNALLLDETAAILWFAQTDGTGYLTVTPYDLMPHQQAQPVDINNLAARVTQLEEMINARQSNSFSNKQSKKQQHATTGEHGNDSAT